MLLRLAYLGVTNALNLLPLLPMSDRGKDAETLDRIRFTPIDRARLAASGHRQRQRRPFALLRLPSLAAGTAYPLIRGESQ